MRSRTIRLKRCHFFRLKKGRLKSFYGTFIACFPRLQKVTAARPNFPLSRESINIGVLVSMKILESQRFRRCQLFLSIWMIFYFPTITFADRAFRCHARLVYIGDSKADVYSKCGEPDHIDEWEENPNGYTSKIYDYEKERYQLPELIKGPIRFEQWTYDLGPNQFNRYLFFQNGELYKIERGNK
jgi:hypothetical protein